MTLACTLRLFGGSITGDGNTQSSPIECKYSQEATFLLDITAITGTLDIEIQTYDWLAENWHKLAEFATESSIGQNQGFIQYGIGENLAISYVTTGTATFTVDVILKQ